MIVSYQVTTFTSLPRPVNTLYLRNRKYAVISVHPRTKLYFIHAEIDTVKYYDRSCLIGRTTYFHSRSLSIFEFKCEKISVWMIYKNIIPLKVLERLLFIRCNASKNPLVRFAHSFVFLMHRNSWIKIVRACVRAYFPWNNLYIL